MTATGLHRLDPDRHEALHPDLDHWRGNVGAPVALDTDASAPHDIDGVDVLCWNTAIGLGRLDALIGQLRAGAFGGAGTAAERPLVVLVQEAFRAGDAVPARAASPHHGGKAPSGPRLDIVEVARRCGLSLRYAPSMRNGTHASDRGNAVLSNVRLDDARAALLPHVRQRRVVVSACLAGHPRIRFVTAHLDTHGAHRDASGNGSRFGGGRAVQARALARMLADFDSSVVLGADLNSIFGMSDPAVRELVSAGMLPARRVGAWRHTFHTRVRLLLDHVMYRSDDAIAAVSVTRLDEAARDRSRAVFGSDHHPLLARLQLHAA